MKKRRADKAPVQQAILIEGVQLESAGCYSMDEIRGIMTQIAKRLWPSVRNEGDAELKINEWLRLDMRLDSKSISALPLFTVLSWLENKAMQTPSFDTTDTTQKTTSPKNPRKKRTMNYESEQCAIRYKADKGKTPMKTIVKDYVDERGGSYDSIMRVLSDNPTTWKATRKTTRKTTS